MNYENSTLQDLERFIAPNELWANQLERDAFTPFLPQDKRICQL